MTKGETLIKVEGVSKKFCRKLSRSMYYGAIDSTRNMLGIPYNTDKLRKDEFWALKDINFELKKGETLGIIGQNGSGKTTLLRLLTGIYPPDAGQISIKGRVGALIAVGAGFHPHMTGRENIYLNGSVLGMSKREIDKKFDEIVYFSGLREFLDAPVATYSSGMKVKLGFSVAVCINPEILLIDEVLSVGDISFQKKASEKLKNIRDNASVIFVSHAMRHFPRICKTGLILNNGRIENSGEINEIVNYYVNKNITTNGQIDGGLTIFNKHSNIKKLDLIINNNKEEIMIYFLDELKIKVITISDEIFNDVFYSVSIFSLDNNLVTVFNSNNLYTSINIKKGTNYMTVCIPSIKLVPGKYNLKIKLALKNGGLLFEADSNYFNILEKIGCFNPPVGFYREEVMWIPYRSI